MNKTMKRILTACLTSVLLILALITPASAKTINAKGTSFTTSYEIAYKNSTAVKKGTAYKINLAETRQCFLRFKAPSTKTYTFKCYGFASKYSMGLGFWYLMRRVEKDYISMEKVKTQGGKNSTLWVGTDKYTGSDGEEYLKSRYGKIKLKKGEVAFLYFSGTGIDSLKLKIS